MLLHNRQVTFNNSIYGNQAVYSGNQLYRTISLRPVEALYAFDAGLNLPISSGCQRRVGLKGVYVVQFDADKNQLSPTSVWARLD